MNILHISRTMGQGGAEKVVYQICKEDYDNKMFIASTGGAYVDMLKKEGVKHFIIPDINGKNPFQMIKTLIILIKIIKKNDIQIVHSHHRMAAFYSRIISIFNKKIKRVYTAHNVFYDKVKLTSFSLKGSQIVAVGNGVKKNLIDVYGIEPNTIEIIYNSIERPTEVSIPKDEFIKNKGNKVFIGTVGRISEQKGMDIFIKALANILKDRDDVYGFIIGDGEDKEKLIKQAKELNIENNVIFLGYRKDIFDLISAMDFIVLASRWEGFPLTPIETFSVGKTIIVSNIPGNNEIVEDNINGLFFEKDNVEDLVEKIRIMMDSSKRSILEKNALKKYDTTYKYERFKEKYSELYSRIK